MVSGAILAGTPRTKFIPVLRRGASQGADSAIPTLFAGTLFIDFREDARFEDAVEQVLRAIYGVRKHDRPPLGTAPAFLRSAVSDVIVHQIRIGETGEIDRVQADLLAHAILKATKKKLTQRFECTVAGYSELKPDARDMNLEASERLRAIQRLLHGERFGVELDDVLAEGMQLLTDRVIDQGFYLTVPEVLGSAIVATIDRLTNGVQTGDTRFDFCHARERWYCAFYVDEAEVVKLEKREDISRMHLTIGWGLKWSDFSIGIPENQIVPAWIEGYLKFRSEQSDIDAAAYFDVAHWGVGLG